MNPESDLPECLVMHPWGGNVTINHAAVDQFGLPLGTSGYDYGVCRAHRPAGSGHPDTDTVLSRSDTGPSDAGRVGSANACGAFAQATVILTGSATVSISESRALDMSDLVCSTLGARPARVIDQTLSMLPASNGMLSRLTKFGHSSMCGAVFY